MFVLCESDGRHSLQCVNDLYYVVNSNRFVSTDFEYRTGIVRKDSLRDLFLRQLHTKPIILLEMSLDVKKLSYDTNYVNMIWY